MRFGISTLAHNAVTALVLFFAAAASAGDGIPWKTGEDGCPSGECYGSQLGGLCYDGCSSEPQDCRVNLHRCFPPIEAYQRLYVETSFLPLRRDVGGQVAYARRQLDIAPGNGVVNPLRTEGPVVLDTDDLQSGYESGMRFGAGFRVTDRLTFEGSYFGLSEFDNTAVVQDDTLNDAGGTGNLYSPIARFGDPLNTTFLFALNNFASINFVSDIHSADVNAMWKFDLPPGRWGFTGLAGVRYMNVNERFRYVTSGDALPGATPARAAVTHDVTTTTNNLLVGPQIGALVQYTLRENAWLDVESKIAFMNNDNRQDTLYTRTGVLPVANVETFGRDSRLAFVGDVAATIKVRMTRFALLDLGYQATFADGLALAQENVAFQQAVLEGGPARVVNNGDVIYHGPRIGVRFAW